jgi:RNA polymerase sigma-70 factor (ECF subfamily)
MNGIENDRANGAKDSSMVTTNMNIPIDHPPLNRSPLDRWDVFERSRRRLHAIAFRILGSSDDAEDVVQETSFRWLRADLATVRAPEGWLVTVATRISVDRARQVARERQVHGDSWDLGQDSGSGWAALETTAEVDVQVTETFHLLHELLSPVERTAFVLREAFACEYDELARVLEKTEAACRQIVHRARERLRRRKARLRLRLHEEPNSAERFVRALVAEDRQAAVAALNDQTTEATPRVTAGVRAIAA